MVLSCGRTKPGTGHVVPFVQRLLSDTLSAEFQSLSKVDLDNVSGSIAVIGAPEDAILISEALLDCDLRDNISGRHVPDQLPDFSGETIAPLLDRANAPYNGFLSGGNPDLLREVTVRNVLLSLDTLCWQRPFDVMPPIRKSGAKLVILASTVSSVYGLDQLDTLRKVALSHLPVFSSLEAMLDDAASRKPGTRHMLVWTSASNYESGVWQDAPAIRNLASPSSCVAYPAADSLSIRDNFLSMLDNYIEEFGTRKISFILLDDPSVDPAEIDAVIASLLASDDDNLVIYRNMLASDAACLSPSRSLRVLVFDYMRKANLFSHMIAYPHFSGMFTAPARGLEDGAYAPSGDFADDFRYLRAQDRPGQDYVPVMLRDRYIPDSLKVFMKQRAPKMYSRYVR